MSEDPKERLKKLVEKCVNSAEVDEALMKSVRSVCRKEESSISTVVVEILWFLKRNHCVVRCVEYLAFNFLGWLMVFQVKVPTTRRILVSQVSCLQSSSAQGYYLRTLN